jgi:hypothetical protein
VKRIFGVGVIAAVLLSGGSVFAAIRPFNAGAMSVSRVAPLPALAGISTATGSCTATLNDQTGEISFGGTFTGLNAPATAVQLRGPAGEGAGPAPVILPATTFTAGVSGTFAGSGTLTIDLASSMIAGMTYCEVRDTPNFSGGEIRGQLVASQPVPALPSWALALLGTLLAGGAVGLLRERAFRVHA